MQLARYVSRHALLVMVTVALLGVVGCGQGDPTPIRITGELVFNAEQVSKGATARVSMFEHGDDGGEKRIVAERTLHQLSTKPIQFEFEVARDLLDAQGDYGLRAQILDADGNVEWTTRETARIQPSTQDKPVSLALTRLADDALPTFEKYQCPDGFFVHIGTVADGILLKMGNRRVTLPEMKTRGQMEIYKDDHGNRLALDADGVADLVIDSSAHEGCVAAASGDQNQNQNQNSAASAGT